MESELRKIEDAIREMERQADFLVPPDGTSTPRVTKTKILALGGSLLEAVCHPVAAVDTTTAVAAVQSRSQGTLVTPTLIQHYPPNPPASSPPPLMGSAEPQLSSHDTAGPRHWSRTLPRYGYRCSLAAEGTRRRRFTWLWRWRGRRCRSF